MNGYTAIFNDSGRPGYGGTAWYNKKGCLFDEVLCQIGDKILDMEGRTIAGKVGNIDLLNFYVPNGNRGPERQAYKMRFYEQMSEQVKKKLTEGGSVIIGGI